MSEKTRLVKADGYNEIFKGSKGNGRVELPFFMQVFEYTTHADFYIRDGLAKRIIDVVPEEMVTPGFNIDGVEDEESFRSLWDEKRLNDKIIDALCWSRLFGGAAIVAIVQDGRALKSPVAPGAILEDVRVYDRFQVRVEKRETNPRKVRYGEPLIYTITPGADLPEYQVHYSRVCIIDGERLPNQRRQSNDGWGESILNKRLVEAICDYNYCENLATQLLRRKQQAVWKAKGLADLCDDDDGVSAARLRLAQVDDEGGVGRAIGIDAEDEEYDVLNSDISGVDSFLEKKMDRIVSLSGIHEIILKNKNVGGVSASQNTALETFYKLIDRKRKEEYKPILEFLIPFLIQEEEWSIQFAPLSVPSEKDQAEILNKNIDSLSKAIDGQFMDTEEARDTLRAIAPNVKLKDGNNIKLPEQDVEPEPGITEGSNQ